MHPAVAVDVPSPSRLFLASGRECAVVTLMARRTAEGIASEGINLSLHGITTLAGPVLAAVGIPRPSLMDRNDDGRGPRRKNRPPPWVAVLTLDGLIHVRSAACVAVPRASIEVGDRSNDFFVLRSLGVENDATRLVTASHSEACRVIRVCHAEGPRERADRWIRLSTDALGPHGYPKERIAAAVGASYRATSYAGFLPVSDPPTPNDDHQQRTEARERLQQHVTSVLCVDRDMDDDDDVEEDDDEYDTEYGTEDSMMEEENGRMDGDDGGMNRRRIFGGGESSWRKDCTNASSLISETACGISSSLASSVSSRRSPTGAALAVRAAVACVSRLELVPPAFGRSAHDRGVKRASDEDDSDKRAAASEACVWISDAL